MFDDFVFRGIFIPLIILFLKNNLHFDNHGTKNCVILKNDISCHMHFNCLFICGKLWDILFNLKAKL